MRWPGILACIGALFGAAQASAQDSVDFIETFSGEWYVFDERFGVGGELCQLELTSERVVADRFVAAAQGCRGALSDLAFWDITDGQVMLRSAGDTEVAALGGSPRRMTGDYVDRPELGIIVERAAGDGTNALINQAIRRHGCMFYGFSDRCVDPGELIEPSYAGDRPQRVELLVNLNVRSQPRADASVIGTIASGTAVVVNGCLGASDGVWCKARFGDRSGWLTRTTLRQNEWAVATYIAAE